MVLFSGLNLVERFSARPPTTSATSSMPLFHSNAVVAGWAPALAVGRGDRARRGSRRTGFLADVRRYGATYMNYVGKPLAYVLATPEQPDDADNPLRVAFGNEASDRDIEEFARRFGCKVVDGFGSTENAVIITRVAGHAAAARSARASTGSRSTTPRRVTECAGRGVRRRTARCSTPTRRSASWSTPQGAGYFAGLLQRPGRQRRADAARHVLVRRPRLPRRRRLDLPRRPHRRLDAGRRREPRRRADRADPPAAPGGQPGRGVRRARRATSATR